MEYSSVIKKELTIDTCNNMYESQKHYTMWKKPYTKYNLSNCMILSRWPSGKQKTIKNKNHISSHVGLG